MNLMDILLAKDVFDQNKLELYSMTIMVEQLDELLINVRDSLSENRDERVMN